jgi:putative membrane protein
MRSTLLPLLLLVPLIPLAAADQVPLTKGDATFLQKAALYNLVETRAATAALERSLTAEEKAYAQEVVRQHTDAGRELSELAKRKNVALDETLPSDYQEELADLGAHGDREFNERYLEQSIARHQQAIRYLESVSEDSHDVDLRNFADQGLIEVRKHLETAKRLEARY